MDLFAYAETQTQSGGFDREVLTVSQLTDRLDSLISAEFGLLWLAGEISNLRRPSSGHYYFVLKDQEAQIRAVMFRPQQRYLGFAPADGQEVLVRGRLSVYGARGEYQIVVDYMEPRGEGALRLAFEKLKAALTAEGLFDPARKKKLPYLPTRVALVTSPTGAAVRDFVRIAQRRFENAHLAVYPVRVQGKGAAEEMARALADLNAQGGWDLIVLTRGGGSIEDLWAFNEEILARAVAASEIPVVSAVGHEVDFTIADFVADLRAPTPSAAAELIFREKDELSAHLAGSRRRLIAGIGGRMALARERLAHLRSRLGKPGRWLDGWRMRLDDRTADLAEAGARQLTRRRQHLGDLATRLGRLDPGASLRLRRVRLEALARNLAMVGRNRPAGARTQLARLAGRLNDLSPLGVLERGYALVRRIPEMTVVKSARELTPGTKLDLLLARGRVGARVEEVEP